MLAEPEEKVPGAHALHVASEVVVQAFETLRLREEHATHVAQGWTPDALQVEPATQGCASSHEEPDQKYSGEEHVHAVWPTAVPGTVPVPVGHGVQVAWPASLAYVLAGHVVHEPGEPAWPGRHGSPSAMALRKL